ncbi:MAG: T4 prohead core scaffold protein, partial [Candidatus Peribacter sp.]|nr:T4 prohead core scaffold protein [Candidatus Peribacter sp.]
MSVDPSNIAEEVIIDSEDNLEEEAVATEEETSEVTEASSDADVEAIEEDTSPEDVDIDAVLETVDCEEIKSVLGDDLNEEDQTKIETIFTAAVREKSAEVSELIKEAYAASNEKVLAEARETMSEQVDSYLDYIVEEWVKENQLAVESGVRGDIAESFIGGLKQLFEDHFISVPEGKYDLVESLQEKS